VVVGCGRTRREIEKLNGEFGDPHGFFVVDVASDKDVGSWAKSALKEHGVPDLLVNNAALINSNANLWEVPAQDFSDVIDVNIKGVMNVIRHFAPAMIERKSGVIVNFSSGWGRSTSPEVGPYCATKYAVEGMTKALAQELPRGMAAVPLNPGMINTEMLQSCFGEEATAHMEPDEWAKSAVPYMLKLGAKDSGRSLSVP